MMSVSDQTRKSLEKVGLTGYENQDFYFTVKNWRAYCFKFKPTIWRSIFKDLRSFEFIRGKRLDWIR